MSPPPDAAPAHARFPLAETEQSIPARFRAQARLHADRPALATRAGALTYAELERSAGALAAAVVERLGPGRDPAALCLPQGRDAVTATLALLLAGKAYVPLDPAWPPERIAAVAAAAGVRLAIADAERAALLPAGLAVLAPDARADAPAEQPATGPGDLAYLYFTTGTTGPPKGVADCHRNVLHNVLRYTNALRLSPADRLSLVQPIGFSGAVSSMFAALLNGACCCPVDLSRETPASLAAWLDELGVTVYHSVPAIFRGVAAAGGRHSSLRVVRLEGDSASPADLALLDRLGPDCILANGLGTTETGLVCQLRLPAGAEPPAGVLPVGPPVEGMQVVVLDEAGAPAAPGAAGRIAVRSPYLALGYWNDPERTAAAFDPPEPGAADRTFTTSDLGRLRADGSLEHLGRLDARARIRGQWVELADVEAALAAVAGVTAAVATASGTDGAGERLVAHLVGPAPRPTASELRRRLAAQLPTHMLPARFEWLDALPLDAHGKVDRRALPAPGASRPALAVPYVGPRTLLEARLCQVWEELLGVAPVGVLDEFLDLGGDSLLAATLLDRAAEAAGRPVPRSAVLAAATVERLAEVLVDADADAGREVVTLNATGTHTPFVFCHGDYLSGGLFTRELARLLGADRPVHAVAPHTDAVPPSYAAMAADRLGAVRAAQPHGPYLLGGVCNGGLVAYELARLLRAAGAEVGTVVLVGSSAANVRFRPLLTATRRLPAGADPVFLALRAALAGREDVRALLRPDRTLPHSELRRAYARADRLSVPGRHDGRVDLLWPDRDPEPAEAAARAWRRVAGEVRVRTVPGDHATAPTRHLPELAAAIRACLE